MHRAQILFAVLLSQSAVAQGPSGPAPVSQPRRAITLCERACGNEVRCGRSPFAECVEECVRTTVEQDANQRQGLTELAALTCEELAALSQPQRPQPAPAPIVAAPATNPQPPREKRVWRCTARGSWLDCPKDSPVCRRRDQEDVDFGATREVARALAERTCTMAMHDLMAANFMSHNSVVTACRATTCTSELQ